MAKEATENAQEESTAVAEETSSLENFEWDTEGTGDFFDIEGTGKPKDEVEEVINKVKKEGEEEETSEATETEEENTEESDETFFGLKKEGDNVTEVQEENEEKEDYYRSIASKMKEQDIFQNIEIPEEGEITEEKFIEYQDLEVEARVDEAFEGFFSELDKDAAAFLKFKKDGGNTAEFFKVYSQGSSAPTGDLDDEAYQEKVSRYYFENVEGGDSEDIDDKIEWLKTSGKLEKYAQKADTKIKDDEKEAKKNLQVQASEAAKAADNSKKAFVDSVQEALNSVDKVDNFIFTPKSKKSLLPFITKATVKVGKNKYMTGMQSKLQTALKTPEKMLVLAQLLENDFDISGMVADSTTVNVKRIKKDVQRAKGSDKPTSSGRIGKKRSLSDVDF